MAKPLNRFAWIKYKLRRISLHWPERKVVFHRIKVAPGEYKCEICANVFKQKDINIDHIQPVISVKDGFNDWNTYVDSLFCEASNLQGICKGCHAIKTKGEQAQRKVNNTLKRKNTTKLRKTVK